MDGNYWQGESFTYFSTAKTIKGEWILVKSHNRDEKGNAWCFGIKGGTGNGEAVSEGRKDSSALTDRPMEKSRRTRDAVWHSNRADPKRGSSN
mgnify:CR=1 FL=1